MIMEGTIPFNSQENLALVEYILFLGQAHYFRGVTRIDRAGDKTSKCARKACAAQHKI